MKKGGSLPSITIYTGVSRDNFSRKKSISRNFCQELGKKKQNKIIEDIRVIPSHDDWWKKEVREQKGNSMMDGIKHTSPIFKAWTLVLGSTC